METFLPHIPVSFSFRFQSRKLKPIQSTHSISHHLFQKVMQFLFIAVEWCFPSISGCLYLTDESGGGALSHPQTELPLLPLPQIPFCTGGDKHRVLVYQRLMENLKNTQTNMWFNEPKLRIHTFLFSLKDKKCQIKKTKNFNNNNIFSNSIIYLLINSRV